MSTGYSSRTWACPFFQSDRKGEVHCEGGVVTLSGRDAFAGYTAKYCASVEGWRKCSLARALVEKYEREDRK